MIPPKTQKRTYLVVIKKPISNQPTREPYLQWLSRRSLEFIITFFKNSKEVVLIYNHDMILRGLDSFECVCNEQILLWNKTSPAGFCGTSIHSLVRTKDYHPSPKCMHDQLLHAWPTLLNLILWPTHTPSIGYPLQLSQLVDEQSQFIHTWAPKGGSTLGI